MPQRRGVTDTVSDDGYPAVTWRTFTTSQRFTINMDRFREQMIHVQEAVTRISERGSTMSIGEIQQGEIHPVPPRKGAYIRINETGALIRFGEWVDKSTAVDLEGTEHKVDTFEVLTPARFGFAFERAVAMPAASRYSGQIISIDGWRSINVIVRVEGRATPDEWPANWVAVLSPPLNPATEKPADAVARLTREKALLEQSIHQRMVAEGTYRGWCSEFDPILDATGLPPRHKKNVITGTLTFTTQLSERDYGQVNEALLEEIKKAPMSYVKSADIRLLEVKADDQSSVGPMLSA